RSSAPPVARSCWRRPERHGCRQRGNRSPTRQDRADSSDLVSTRPSQEWWGTGTGHRPDRIRPSDDAVTPRVVTDVRRTQAGPPPFAKLMRLIGDSVIVQLSCKMQPHLLHTPSVAIHNQEDLEMNPTTTNGATPEPTTPATPFVTRCRD